MSWELMTVADDEAVAFDGPVVRRYEDLRPDTDYTYDGLDFRTLARPGGELLARVATVNDAHFGETRCGVVEGTDVGPILTAEPGDPPHPEVMNRAAAAEMAAVRPDAVIVKGDLTSKGVAEEVAAFEDCYRGPFGDRLHVVPGNHDVAGPEPLLPGGPRSLDVPGARFALLDTTIAGRASGTVDQDQLDWLDDACAAVDGRAVVVAGHHHAYDPGAVPPDGEYFGIDPASSARLAAVVARHPAVVAVLAGHTHRNRVRRFAATGGVPWIEVAAVKDFPGTWAEYRVFDGGVLQIHRRIAEPAAVAWSERCRALYYGLYPDYALGSLGDRCLALGR